MQPATTSLSRRGEILDANLLIPSKFSGERLALTAERDGSHGSTSAKAMVTTLSQVGTASLRPEKAPAKSLTSKYNEAMKSAMLNPYEYHHELGIYYTTILDNLIVGSQPQSPADIDMLVNEEGVTAVLNLQQEEDIRYWGVDIAAVGWRCHELQVPLIRRPARDFDPNSLRAQLPYTVGTLARLLDDGHKVYVHCTAGLGRAPGVAISYLFWFQNMTLQSAYDFLTAKRPCGPKKEAIRGATHDVLRQGRWHEFDHLPAHAFVDISHEERRIIMERVRHMGRRDTSGRLGLVL
eukprot:jgi/Mesvir1/12261/Mv00476-RA.1